MIPEVPMSSLAGREGPRKRRGSGGRGVRAWAQRGVPGLRWGVPVPLQGVLAPVGEWTEGLQESQTFPKAHLLGKVVES